MVIKINCEKFDIPAGMIEDFLTRLSRNDRLKRGKNQAKNILYKIRHNISLDKTELISLTEIYFLYSRKLREVMVKQKQWFVIGSKQEALKYKSKLETLAKSYGEYRYKKDYGWLGVYAERKVKKFMRDELKLSFKEWENSGNSKKNQWQNKVDQYDIKIYNKNIDVKCATQPHYLEITPKVTVENEIPKDIYLATKFFDDGILYLTGYIIHDDLTKYPKKRLYGAEYYAVKLYDTQCLNDLLNNLN